MKPSELYFEIDGGDEDDDLYIILTPITFWDEHQHSTDKHFAGSIEGLPVNWEEVAESQFVVDGLSVSELRKKAIELGMKPLPVDEDDDDDDFDDDEDLDEDDD